MFFFYCGMLMSETISLLCLKLLLLLLTLRAPVTRYKRKSLICSYWQSPLYEVIVIYLLFVVNIMVINYYGEEGELNNYFSQYINIGLFVGLKNYHFILNM